MANTGGGGGIGPLARSGRDCLERRGREKGNIDACHREKYKLKLQGKIEAHGESKAREQRNIHTLTRSQRQNQRYTTMRFF